MKTILKCFFVVILALSPLAMISSISAQNGSTYEFILEWGEAGSGNGRFNGPFGVAVDSNDNVYVTDIYNNRVQKFNSTGSFITKWGTPGTGDGQFNGPRGIAVDSTDNVYVVDEYNHRVQKFSSTGSFILEWGTLGTGGGQFDRPVDIAVDSTDNIYVTDLNNHRVQKFTSTGGFILQWGTLGTGDGQFNETRGIAVDSNDDVYVGDLNNYRVQKFNSTGAFITKWGTSGIGDGEFSRIQGLCVDLNDDVFVADLDNDRVQKFSSTGSFVLEWGTSGTGDGEFNGPAGVAADPSGEIYVTDHYNDRVQKFSTPDTTPPTITVISPQDNAIINEVKYGLSFILVNYTASDNVSWVGVSLNGQPNITITVNPFPIYGYPDGSYSLIVYANDTVGNMGASTTIHFTLDITPPNILSVSQNPPEDNVLPTDAVEINATVTDDTSGVKEVILKYNNGNGAWINVGMTNLEENIWNAAIPSFPDSTNVTYVVTAEDNANNIITTENVFGYTYQYSVIPEFPSLMILPLSIITTLVAIILYRKKRTTLH